ncbi:PREDICTED: probable E3 ubiquitin ligase SUD1 [Camelina sativa]|uniref:Probable E3 ubiquitin ligase SUD1 n=1 Tax=Camelina sativa TaxID=90675 RepID=A0ABM0UWH2_CAMSA|nr:PREDICTED: probable E3 ubiquitin ligase SUD1 [Camelina sativa]
MEISPTEDKLVGSGDDEAVPTQVSVIKNEALDICRICQSPDEPNNPLRHPCACRGSLKFVHSDCLFLWLNRRKRNHCEICKRRYSTVPIYSENAPERLSCHEFLMGLLLRALRFMTWILPWVLMIPFNAYCFSFLPLDKETEFVNQTVLELSLKFPGLFYTAEIVFDITFMVVSMEIMEEILRRHPELLRLMIILENGLRDRDVTGVLLLLGNHLHILNDWWHDQLLHLPFLHIFQRGPLPLVFVPRNTPLHQFGSIRRVFFLFNDDTFAVLAINIYWSSLKVFIPFSIGRAVFFLLRCFPHVWIEENASELAAGKMVIFSVLLAYLGSVFPLPRNRTRLRWFSPPVKKTFILCFKLGVLPCILGCWLDFCTSPIMGETVSQSIEVLSDYPHLAAKHWHMGIFYLVVAIRCMEAIQKILQKRAFWYLIDVAEPNYKITKLHLGPILLAFALHGAMVVVVLYLPVKTMSLISQSFFPLQFGVYDEDFVLGLLIAYTCLIRLGPRWLVNYITPSLRPIVHKWVITISSMLKLSDFLLGEPRRDRVNRNMRPQFLLFGVAEGSMVSLYGSQSDTTCEEDTNDQRDKSFMLRIGVMFVLAAMSMFLVSTTLMALPILVGRAFGLKHDDLCAFWIGFCILRGIYIFICFVYDHFVTGRTDLLLNHALMFIRNVLLFSIWISIIPGLLGLLINLMIIIPSQVPLHDSPVYKLHHNWLRGVVVLHIWIFLTMRTRINCFTTVAWREKLQRIRSVGINRLPFTWLIRDVIGSIIVSLLFTLCVPYVVVNSLFPILGFSDEVNLAVQRFIWPAILTLIPIWFSVKLTRDLIIYLHQLEFDHRYKVGERLMDFTEDLAGVTTTKTNG